MTERQILWVQQLKNGSERAAFKLYDSYSKSMFNTLVRISGDTEVAKDLLQESFVKAFQHIDSLKEAKMFSGWLKRIVINTGIAYTRKKQYIYESIEDRSEDGTLGNEENMEAIMNETQIHQAIKELPDGCRTVLCLYLLEGLKHSEISEELNISVSTSKTQYRHAKVLLKKKLIQDYEY